MKRTRMTPGKSASRTRLPTFRQAEGELFLVEIRSRGNRSPKERGRLCEEFQPTNCSSCEPIRSATEAESQADSSFLNLNS
mmetsp:Transcript_77670/g.137033  ORF Transcript_77670/g.137033 Transcript_77670/m.137033 type:complete len:81 (-) Transcript_77670:39-281(-)